MKGIFIVVCFCLIGIYLSNAMYGRLEYRHDRRYSDQIRSHDKTRTAIVRECTLQYPKNLMRRAKCYGRLLATT